MIHVIMVQLIEIDHHGLTLAPYRIAVHASCRPTGNEYSVRLVLRMVFGTLEPAFFFQPAKRGVLVRTGEGEGKKVRLVTNQDNLVVTIDAGAILGRNRVSQILQAPLAWRKDRYRNGQQL